MQYDTAGDESCISKNILFVCIHIYITYLKGRGVTKSKIQRQLYLYSILARQKELYKN